MSEEKSQNQQQEISSYDLYNSYLINFVNVEFLSDIINVSLYQSDLNNSSSSEREVVKFIGNFLRSLKKDIRNAPNLEISTQKYINLITTCERILDLKVDFSSIVINYDNVFNHFTSLDTNTRKIIQNVQKTKIFDTRIFRKKLDYILKTIQGYNKINDVALPTMLKFGTLMAEASQGGTTPTVWLSNFLETLHIGYSNLTELKELSKEDSLTDYMVFDDPDSVDIIADELMDFLSTNFKRYKTGYDVIDGPLGKGSIESGSVSIISGPSNHAKSIFMINIVKNIIELNDWKENDAVLMITLEDDKFKLVSRVDSIFGNYNASGVKDGYEKTSNLSIKKPELKSQTKAFWANHFKSSIIEVTDKKCKLFLKHSTENSFSMADVNTFIDKLQMDGTNVKFVAIDYIDVMNASHSKYTVTNDDYNLHGDIVHNMRECAKARGIPILTITQDNRGSENKEVASYSDIGGSIKKVRYCDLLIQIKQENQKDLMDAEFKQDVNLSQVTNTSIPTEMEKDVIPFKVAITKNKNGDRDMTQFHIFSKSNLRIYKDTVTYANDMKKCQKRSKIMADKLDSLEFSNSNNGVEFGDLMKI